VSTIAPTFLQIGHLLPQVIVQYYEIVTIADDSVTLELDIDQIKKSIIIISLATLESPPKWLNQLAQSDMSFGLCVIVNPDQQNDPQLIEYFNQWPIYQFIDSKNLDFAYKNLNKSLELKLNNEQLYEQKKLIEAYQTELNQNQSLLKEKIKERKLEIQNKTTRLRKLTTELEQIKNFAFKLSKSSSINGVTIEINRLFKKWSIPHKDSSHFDFAEPTPLEEIKADLNQLFLSSELIELPSQLFASKESIDQVINLTHQSLKRIHTWELLDEQNRFWKASFESVKNPFIIVTKNYEVLRINQKWPSNKKHTKCYEILFQRSSPCPQCKMGYYHEFELEQKNSIYEVQSQKFISPESLEPTFLNYYSDQTQHISMTTENIEIAKLNELGIISSSMAHELNNPLAGMLSYAQLIKLDLDPHLSYIQDIESLEEGIRRCRDIVNKLLLFTRGSWQKDQEISLYDLIQTTSALAQIKDFTHLLKFSYKIDSKIKIPESQRTHLMIILMNIYKLLIASLKKNDVPVEIFILLSVTQKTFNVSIKITPPCFNNDQIPMINTIIADMQNIKIKLNTDQGQVSLIKLLIPRLDFEPNF